MRDKPLVSKKVCNGCTLVCNGCTLFLKAHLIFALLQCKSAKIIIDMTKAELENKRNLARTLYLSGKEQTEIAEMIGVSRVTISKWCTADGWKATRAAKTITRPELIKKLLGQQSKTDKRHAQQLRVPRPDRWRGHHPI